MLAMFLLVEIEMAVIFPSIKGALLMLMETIDLVVTAIIVLALVVVFVMLRSARRQE